MCVGISLLITAGIWNIAQNNKNPYYVYVGIK